MYSELNTAFFVPEFTIQLFSEFDQDKFIKDVCALNWDTSYKLFNEVFSENSRYMTVHQAKGLEWEQVIISVTPNRFDKTDLTSLYTSPELIQENPAEEFVRMYYVACSRAKEDLYIHITDTSIKKAVEASIREFSNKSGRTINYELLY